MRADLLGWSEKGGLLEYIFIFTGAVADIFFYTFVLHKMKDIWSNITLRLKEFPRAKPEGTHEGN